MQYSIVMQLQQEYFHHLLGLDHIQQDLIADMISWQGDDREFKSLLQTSIFIHHQMIPKSKCKLWYLYYELLINIRSFYYSCENVDSLQAYVYIDGRLEKIDSFCGSTLPRPIMSNGPRMTLEFRGIYSSRQTKGFKANFTFTDSEYFEQMNLFET